MFELSELFGLCWFELFGLLELFELFELFALCLFELCWFVLYFFLSCGCLSRWSCVCFELIWLFWVV